MTFMGISLAEAEKQKRLHTLTCPSISVASEIEFTKRKTERGIAIMVINKEAQNAEMTRIR